MKEKSDIRKLIEGRCRGLGADYVPFKKANESHSTGTATIIYDPIIGRRVHTLSEGETTFFWLTRFDEHVVAIYEQMILFPHILTPIAIKCGFRIPNHILTTDFLVEYDDGSFKAYSIKRTRSILNENHYKNLSSFYALIRRQILEKKHWEELGIEWKLVFSDELNERKAKVISSIMKCYDSKRVRTPDQMYRYLIAHRHIVIDMEDYVPFAEIANEYENEIRELYERVTKHENH